MNILKYDSLIIYKLAKVFDLIYLNIIFIVFCIPVVTAGPAIIALNTCVQSLGNKEIKITKTFIRAFKENIVKNICQWIGFLAVIIFFVFDIFIVNTMDNNYRTFFITFFSVIICFILIFADVFYLCRTVYKNHTIQYTLSFIKNNVLTVLALEILKLIPALFVIVSIKMIYIIIPLLAFIGISAIAYLRSRIFIRKIQKHPLTFTK